MTRTNRLSIALVAVFACCLMFSAAAFGATGDSAPTATNLAPYLGSSLTTNLAGNSAAGSNTSYYFKIELYKGQTLNADIVPGPHVVNLKALVLYGSVTQGTKISSTLYRLRYTAPTHTIFTVYIATSGRDDQSTDGTLTPPGTFKISPTVLSPVTVTAPLASYKPTHKKATTIKGKVSPGHTTPVTITIQRKVSGKWKSYATVRLTSSSGGNWSFKRKFAARTYRMRATTPATNKYLAGASAWRTIKVK